MSYIGQTLTEGTRRAYTFTATASQTTFNAVYGVGAVDVYQNGILLQPSDYNSSSGSSVVLGVGAAVNDEITIIAHNTFSVADTVSSSQGGTFAGAVTASNGLTVDDDGATPLTVDRATNAGTIIDVQKDGTQVGNIGVEFTDNLFIGGNSSHCTLGFGTSAIYPSDGNSGGSDADTDIGSAANRFKDLYLSGGAYIGGTGAANKLDDYEEGTFTATLVGYHGNPSSAVTTTGYYTKIGNMVTIFLAFESANTSGASGDMWVTGLPFAHSGAYTILSCSMNSAGTFPNSSPFGLISGTICYFYKHVSNSNPTAVYHNAGTNRAIRVTGNYRVA